MLPFLKIDMRHWGPLHQRPHSYGDEHTTLGPERRRGQVLFLLSLFLYSRHESYPDYTPYFPSYSVPLRKSQVKPRQAVIFLTYFSVFLVNHRLSVLGMSQRHGSIWEVEEEEREGLAPNPPEAWTHAPNDPTHIVTSHTVNVNFRAGR